MIWDSEDAFVRRNSKPKGNDIACGAGLGSSAGQDRRHRVCVVNWLSPPSGGLSLNAGL